MILLDIAAPVFLLLGLKLANAATVSLLGNFEIAATALIAMVLFREAASRRLWLAILFITISCVVLSFGDVITRFCGLWTQHHLLREGIPIVDIL